LQDRLLLPGGLGPRHLWRQHECLLWVTSEAPLLLLLLLLVCCHNRCLLMCHKCCGHQLLHLLLLL
jgi:hypothetical protein